MPPMPSEPDGPPQRGRATEVADSLERLLRAPHFDDSHRAKASQLAARWWELLTDPFSGAEEAARAAESVQAAAEQATDESPAAASDAATRPPARPGTDAEDDPIHLTESPDLPRPLLLFSTDEQLAADLRQHAAAFGFIVRVVTPDATSMPAVTTAEAVIVDATRLAQWRELTAALAASDDAPVVLVRSDATDSEIRLEATRAGATTFLDDTMGGMEILETVRGTLRPAETTPQLLVFSPTATELPEAVTRLAEHGCRTERLRSANELLSALHDQMPDVLLFDSALATAAELARLVRGDRRWRHLPMLALARDPAPSAVQRAYAAGVDDVVELPVPAAILHARLRLRLERVRQLKELADRDPLTGLANRRKLDEQVGRLLAMATRQGTNVALALLDVDHFKAINDRHGHLAGDAVLRLLAARLHHSFRDEDVVARIGGDEMVIVMFDADRSRGARRTADVLHHATSEGITQPHGPAIEVEVSAGVAQFPEDGEDLDGLYAAADRALHLAKQGGRGQVVEAEPPLDGAAAPDRDQPSRL